MEQNIDITITWVDSNDPKWREEKNQYSQTKETKAAVDDGEARYRDWEVVKYLLRSIEMYMPWVRYVFFITYGHLPSWMNVHYEKLKIVNHQDFIPKEYLPTFCSHTIELNMHRIEELSEQFIYFNDDILVLRPIEKEEFFCKGLPRDYAVLNPINCATRFSVQDIALTDVEVINDNFNKKEQIRKNFSKWISPCYGKYLFRTFCLLSWPSFVGFLSKHQGNAFLKSTFREVWEKEFSILDSTCRHRFRTRRDVNQWLMRYWQLASGKFLPIRPYGELHVIGNDNTKLFDAINNCKEKSICVNDNNLEKIIDYKKTKNELIDVLEKRFPVKSGFEL